MLVDYDLQLSKAQVVTSTAVSTNSIDLGGVYDMSQGEQIFVVVTVAAVVTASGSATVAVGVISDTVASLATPTDLHLTEAIPKVRLVAGFECLRWALPRHESRASGSDKRALEGFIGVEYTVATGPLTDVSAFNAILTTTPQTTPPTYI